MVQHLVAHSKYSFCIESKSGFRILMLAGKAIATAAAQQGFLALGTASVHGNSDRSHG